MAQINDPLNGLYQQNGRYKHEFQELEDPIGRGSFGIVFEARNTIDGKNYAIKKIPILSQINII